MQIDRDCSFLVMLRCSPALLHSLDLLKFHSTVYRGLAYKLISSWFLIYRLYSDDASYNDEIDSNYRKNSDE